MPEVKVHLVGVEGEAERSVTETTTIGELFAELFGQDRSAIAAKVNGELRDLARVVEDGDEIEPVKSDSADGLANRINSLLTLMSTPSFLACRSRLPVAGWLSVMLDASPTQ